MKRKHARDHWHPRQRGRTFIDEAEDWLYFSWHDKLQPRDRVFAVLCGALCVVAVVVWVWAFR